MRRIVFTKKLPNVGNFHTNLLKQQKSQVRIFADEMLKELPKDAKLETILKAVWNNPKVTAVCPDLIIRLTSLRGQVSRTIWESLGNNPKDINIFAVGTTAIPQHMTSYHKFLKNFYAKSAEYANKAHEGTSFDIGYDLMSQGSFDSREDVLSMFNQHYGFPTEMLKKVQSNSAITSGGMRGLKDLADSCVEFSRVKDSFHRFIQPDNSFGTWFNIIEKPERNDTNRRRIHTIKTSPEAKLHLTAQDVDDFYAQHKAHDYESWYITPVGNPSGTKMKPDQLVSTCERIIKHNPKALILLDTVYCRTLPKQQSKDLFKGVIANEEIINQVIFVDSFSKSHGLCSERLGIYFSVNEALFRKHHASNIAFSAGPGVFKNFQFKALGNMSQEDQNAISDLHEFWRKEREGVYKFLMKYQDLFSSDQKHITNDDIKNTLGLYILLKTQPNVKAADVFMKTGILGVDTALLSGHYIRFSVGAVTEPIYSK